MRLANLKPVVEKIANDAWSDFEVILDQLVGRF